MEIEKQRFLVKTYPNLYKQGMSFDCEDGWFDLINDLSYKLEPLILKENEEIDEDFFSYATQVKEKFGGLRFYMSTATDQMYELIYDAEDTSLVTCELCGKPGKINNHAWVTCRCNSCV